MEETDASKEEANQSTKEHPILDLPNYGNKEPEASKHGKKVVKPVVKHVSTTKITRQVVRIAQAIDKGLGKGLFWDLPFFLPTFEIHLFCVATYIQNYLLVLTWVHLILGLGVQKLPIGQ